VAVVAHVAAIEADHLRLGGDCRQLLAQLKASSFAPQLFRDSQLRPCLRLPPMGSLFNQPQLNELLLWLAQHEVAFAEVPDRGAYGPAELMRALQADGSVPVAFRSLLRRSEDDYSLIDFPRPL
jgi:hypothetical protein